MKVKKLIISVIILSLCSCSQMKSQSDSSGSQPLTTYSQDIGQLYIDIPEGYSPLNYQSQIGQWFPYMYYSDYMYGKSEDEFRNSVREMFADAKSNGVNTVYLHVHPNGDAYYKSEIFPRGISLDGDYDPLEIMLEEAHALELSAHAWLNPLRLQTVEQMENVPDNFITKQWTKESEKNLVKKVNGRWYLNPAYDEISELLSKCVEELLENYDLDGIHIDDYFYPTTDPEFDKEAFAASGNSDLAEWRMENCTHFVKAIYDSVKAYDKRILFGISPQGNINGNYTSQYADVRLWGGNPGYCDYIVPQIYFGFENSVCPFDKALADWELLRSDSGVQLIIGLAAYKLGKEDQWAGEAGEQEWIENPDIIDRQIELVKNSSANGYALYY